MQKVSFELEDEIYGEARKLVGTRYASLRELVQTAIKDDYEKKFGGWPPSEYPKRKSVYEVILDRRLKKIERESLIYSQT